ncbi:hypothetical protein B0T14DRAFT_517761 [Immersiella caudata]|uniref:Uncharacterized protein n=1 Tax=Immersiella caudata TaxID=314043 RepID=A0AA39WZ40_9PEZI|nr:hypothetical protein B0T14DRAFT_517761 [Immersiella caudata]
MGMQDALGLLDDSSTKLARLGLVFELNTLVTTNENGDLIPRERTADIIKYLLDNQITFVVFHNSVKISEKLLALHLNNALGLPGDFQIPFSNFLVATSPLRTAIGCNAHNPDEEKVVLVIGGSGEQPRRLAHDYGYPFVFTTADVTRCYDQFFSYHNPAHDPPEDAPLDPYWRMRKRNKHVKVAGILVFWEPENWELDVEVILHIFLNCGRLGYNCAADNEALTPGKLANKIAKNMPPLHICLADIAKNPSASADAAATSPVRSWLRFLRESWTEKTKNRPWLRHTLHGPEAGHSLLRAVEWTLNNSDRRTYAKMVSKDEDEIDIPKIKSVYTIGLSLEGKYAPQSSAKWGDIVLKGQQEPAEPRKLGVKKHEPEFVASDLVEAVEYGLVQAYWRAVDNGLEPMWPAPKEPRPVVEEQPRLEERPTVAKRVEQMEAEEPPAREMGEEKAWMGAFSGWLGGIICCGGTR